MAGEAARLPAESVIAVELELGERLLWAGKPKQGIVFQLSDLFLIPFAIAWTLVSLTITGGSLYAIITGDYVPGDSKGGIGLFPVVGVVFLVIGFYQLVGRFFIDAVVRSKTYYGVTSDRVIVVMNFGGRRVKSVQLRTMTDINLSERGRKRGTISFGPQLPFGSREGETFGLESLKSSRFFAIDNAREVYKLLLDAQRNARA